jgi:hypothetical protein
MVPAKALKLLGADETLIVCDKAVRTLGVDPEERRNQKAMNVLGEKIHSQDPLSHSHTNASEPLSIWNLRLFFSDTAKVAACRHSQESPRR